MAMGLMLALYEYTAGKMFIRYSWITWL